MYPVLNIFFLVFHSALILFNLFGWVFKPLRIANLVTLLLTACSWLFLGIFYGFGYCPFTDWHYDVLYKMGHTNLPDSYIQYLLETFFHLEVPQKTTDTATLLGLVLALICSVYVNFFRRKHQSKELI